MRLWQKILQLKINSFIWSRYLSLKLKNGRMLNVTKQEKNSMNAEGLLSWPFHWFSYQEYLHCGHTMTKILIFFGFSINFYFDEFFYTYLPGCNTRLLLSIPFFIWCNSTWYTMWYFFLLSKFSLTTSFIEFNDDFFASFYGSFLLFYAFPFQFLTYTRTCKTTDKTRNFVAIERNSQRI